MSTCAPADPLVPRAELAGPQAPAQPGNNPSDNVTPGLALHCDLRSNPLSTHSLQQQVTSKAKPHH